MISLPEVHNLNPIKRKHLTDQTEEHSTKCIKVTKYKKQTQICSRLKNMQEM